MSGACSMPQGDGVVAVAVSRAQVGRAVALVDLILRTAERRGMTVAVVPEPGPHWGVQRKVVQVVHMDLGFGFALTRARNTRCQPAGRHLVVAAPLAVHPDRAAAGQARVRAHPRRYQSAGHVR